MKSLSPDLQTHLDSGTTTLAWCWRLTRKDGVVFGFTDHDRMLVIDGQSYEPETGLTPSEIRAGTELAVDAQEAEGVLRSDRITETDILDGLWDNAGVEAWRVNWADTSQRVLMRRGSIGEIRRGRLAFVAEIRSMAHVLNQTVGRTFQATCDALCGDARCGVDLESPAFNGTGSVIALTGDRTFTASGLDGFAAGWFALGMVEWLTGVNAGRRAEIQAHDRTGTDIAITLLEAPVRAIAVGDTAVLRAGCDKRLVTCSAKFANTANFRGFPHMPGQDAMIRFATKSGGHTGEVLS